MRFKDRVAVITGGTGGLGKQVISVFLSEGTSVYTTYIDRSQLAVSLDLKEEYGEKLQFRKADVTKASHMSKIVEGAINKFGRVDFLINIVGGFAMAKLVDTEEALWNKMMNMNLNSVFVSSKAVLPQMMEQKYGRIINIGARPALTGVKNMSAYGASKAGVINLTQSMADELSDSNINVNAIIPGTMDTPRNRKDMPKADFKKWVKPEDIAEVIAFLCSNEGDKISGAILPVYGKT
ncbi:MAG: 3-ketoacyl-ACP reductase [Thermodesulfobacteriota bacterium]|nr:MAG: 3-ketoacyl-ACP reductase [Thermodesulfobacteriota bacterium]